MARFTRQRDSAGHEEKNIIRGIVHSMARRIQFIKEVMTINRSSHQQWKNPGGQFTFLMKAIPIM